jgi:hypothetical protein
VIEHGAAGSPITLLLGPGHPVRRAIEQMRRDAPDPASMPPASDLPPHRPPPVVTLMYLFGVLGRVLWILGAVSGRPVIWMSSG